MKKLFMFASAAALLATSCSDDLGLKQETSVEGKGNTCLIASLPLGTGTDAETRTTLETNAAGTKKYYTWNAGDAIGVFVADNTAGDDTNAIFTYTTATSTTQAQFNGDVMALDGTGFYGYYPYYQTAKLLPSGDELLPEGVEGSGPFLKMSINANQNYNHEAAPASQDQYELTVPSGSFSQGAAPAVAVGSLNGKNLNMTFRACASYLVFPVKSYQARTIESLTLTISDTATEENQILAGDFYVNMSEVYNGYLNYEITSASEINEGKVITVKCGQGVEMAAGDVVNFWFVVPSGISLQGQTATVVVNAGKESYTISKSFGETAPVITGANNLWVVTPEKNTPWAFTSTDNAVLIQNQAQFLEYAYLVTNGKKAVIEWLEMAVKEPSMVNYSNLPYMLQYYGQYNINDMIDDYRENQSEAFNVGQYIKTTVKEAQVVNDITFNTTNLVNELKAQGLTLNAPTYVPKYYLNVFQNFVNTGYFNGPIGTGYEFTMSGSKTLTNLPVKGNSLFNGSSTAGATVTGLTFTDPVLNVNNVKANYYTLLAQPNYTYFSGVTVNGGSFKNTVGTAPQALFGYDASIFYYAAGNDIVPVTNKTTDVKNNSGLKFAYDLNINSPAYNFTTNGRGVSDFVNINLRDYGYGDNSNNMRQGYGSLLTVNNGVDNAVELMKAIESNKANSASTPYSVVDSTTSYWTGRSRNANNTGWIATGTAEYLATVVQQGITDPVTLTRNINLMGVYNEAVYRVWWTKNEQTHITLKGAGKEITNVWINGTNGGKNIVNNAYLSLLGWFVNASNVTVSGVTIDNLVKAPTTPSIGVIGVQPEGVVSKVTLTNFIVNSKTGPSFVNKKPAVGGMFAVAYDSDVNVMTDILVTYSNYEGVADGIACGDVAGTLLVNMNSVVNQLNNPNAANTSSNPFGVVQVTVNGQKGQASFLNLNGFNDEYYKYPIYVAGKSGEVTIAGGYSLYVNLNKVQWLTQFVEYTDATTPYGFGVNWSTVNPPQTPKN